MASLSTSVRTATKAAARGFHSSAAAQGRKFFVGGNWKCNGSMKMVEDMTNILNSAQLSKDTEVVICPPAVYTFP